MAAALESSGQMTRLEMDLLPGVSKKSAKNQIDFEPHLKQDRVKESRPIQKHEEEDEPVAPFVPADSSKASNSKEAGIKNKGSAGVLEWQKSLKGPVSSKPLNEGSFSQEDLDSLSQGNRSLEKERLGSFLWSLPKETSGLATLSLKNFMDSLIVQSQS